MIKNRHTALALRAGAFLFTFIGLANHLGLFRGTFHAGSLMYYTIQSNLLALLLFGLLTYKTIAALRNTGPTGTCGFFPRFEMVCTVDLLLTFLVYWILLVPSTFSMTGDYSLFTFDNLAVHLVTPLLCLLDYILFTPPGHLRYRDIYAVLIFPLAYVAFTSIAGLLGYVYRFSQSGAPVRFPYFFMDYDALGLSALLYIAAIALVFLAITHVFYAVDGWRAKRAGRKVL